jgi:hypothetical protein
LPTPLTLDRSIRLTGLPVQPRMAIGQTDSKVMEAAR